MCLLRRTLPGIGFAFTFVGIILQLLHDLNKNVYTVNPERVFRCGISREDGLFIMGLVLVSVQLCLSGAWLAIDVPSVQCMKQLTYTKQCGSMTNFQQTFFFSLSYPVFLGIIIW